MKCPTVYKEQFIMDHSRIRRIIRLLTALGSREPYTVNDLAKMFSVARRTIFRDLRLLQNIGVPYYYNHKDRCCKIEPHFSLSCPNLTEQEAFALLLLAKIAKSVNFPFRTSVLQAALKIESSLPEEIRRYCNTALGDIIIFPNPMRKTARLNALFAQLIKAVMKRRIVEIHYHTPDSREYKVLELEPYHLKYSGNAWYMIGKSRTNNAVTVFNFNQINDVKLQDRYFFLEDEFDIDEYLGRAWPMEPEGKPYHVKLRFLPEIACEIAETQWHSTQQVSYETDGSAIVEFRVDGLNEIKWRVLSYGDKLQVLEPKILREMITEIAENIVSLNW